MTLLHDEMGTQIGFDLLWYLKASKSQFKMEYKAICLI